MNVELFQRMYHTLAEQRINQFGNMCEDPYFDKLLAVMNSSWGYKLFYPLSSDFDKYGIDFDTYCRKIWFNVTHAVDDDGVICFVHTVLQGETGSMKRKWTTDNFFVMDGHIAEVSKDKIFDIARQHLPEGMTLYSYSGIRFDWELVDFLCRLINDFESVERARNELPSVGGFASIGLWQRVRDMEKVIEKKFDDYMVVQNGYFNSLNGELK
jgi:hypothetical protein